MDVDDFINYILEIFKKNKTNYSLINELKNSSALVEEFELRYLKHKVDTKFTIDIVQEQSSTFKTIIVKAEDGSLYQLSAIKNQKTAKWQLKSFMFQCQSCFGDDRECNVCGGSEWGVL